MNQHPCQMLNNKHIETCYLFKLQPFDDAFPMIHMTTRQHDHTFSKFEILLTYGAPKFKHIYI